MLTLLDVFAPCIVNPISHKKRVECLSEEEPSEESRPVKGGQSRVMMPTLKERQEHEWTYLPYRSWCRDCVAARASNPAHRGRKFAKAVEDDKDMKQVTHGYCFLRDQPETESAKILVSKDHATRMGSAHVVPLKGAVLDWVIQQRARDLERLGHHGQVTLKSDQEPAIVDVFGEKSRIFVGLVERCWSTRQLQAHSRTCSLSAESGQLRR